MLSFKFSKNRPLQIKDKETNEIIELVVPENYKNASMTINLIMSKRFEIIRKSVVTENKKEVSCENKRMAKSK